MHTIDTTKYNLRTDLVIERENFETTQRQTIYLKNTIINRLKTANHDYVTISFEDITDKNNFKEIEKICIKELKQIVSKYQLKKEDPVLVIGLGNSMSTPDSLGPKTIDNVLVTSHLYRIGDVENTYQNVSAFKPEVTGITGIETSEMIKSIVKTTQTKLLIVVDALAASSIKRVNKTIQITDSGIEPGSGVGNNRTALNKDELEIPVVAIGVPTIVDASTIVSETFEYIKQHFSYQLSITGSYQNKLVHPLNQDYSNHKTKLSNDQIETILGELGKLKQLELKQLIDEVLIPVKYNLMVTPKDIDFLIDKLSLLIANTINKTLHDQFNPTK